MRRRAGVARGLVVVAALAALLVTACEPIGSTKRTSEPPEPPEPTEPSVPTREDFASGAALAEFLRTGVADALTARAVQAVLDAVPADELDALVAELGQVRLDGDMSAMLANRSLRRVMTMTAPLYDAEFGAVPAAAAGRTMQVAADSDDLLAGIRGYWSKSAALVRGVLGKGKKGVNRAINEVNDPSWQSALLGGLLVGKVCVATAGFACPLALGAYVGAMWSANRPTAQEVKDTFSGTDEVFTDAVQKAFDERPAATVNTFADELSPCDAQSCEPNRELEPVGFGFMAEREVMAGFKYKVDTAIASLVLPAASGGREPIVYSLEPTIPGLQFNVATRTLAGTPTEAGTYYMSYDATDDWKEYARLSFTVTVGSFGFDTVVSDRTLSLGVAMQPLVLPEATGGVDPVVYGLFFDVPGLDVDLATRTLTGTPTVLGSYTLDWGATDANGEKASLSFTLVVAEEKKSVVGEAVFKRDRPDDGWQSPSTSCKPPELIVKTREYEDEAAFYDAFWGDLWREATEEVGYAVRIVSFVDNSGHGGNCHAVGVGVSWREPDTNAYCYHATQTGHFTLGEAEFYALRDCKRSYGEIVADCRVLYSNCIPW